MCDMRAVHLIGRIRSIAVRRCRMRRAVRHNIMTPTDQQKDLMLRLRRGTDEDAVRILVEQYGQRLLSAAVVLCGNHADAEELMVETLRRAVAEIGSFRETSSLFSWMYGILFNLRRMLWRKRASSRVAYTDVLPEVACDAPDPLEGAAAADAAGCLADAVAQLPEPMRDVVRLRYFGEMSIAEVAETLGVPAGTVKSRLFNALARLREILPGDFMF